jgi:hypothetical protein
MQVMIGRQAREEEVALGGSSNGYVLTEFSNIGVVS